MNDLRGDASQPDAVAIGSLGPCFVDLPRAHGEPLVFGHLRTSAEDFIVEEQLPFVPDGTGEHLLLRVRKIGQNTDWVARRLAEVAGIAARDVGYAGLKDRHAVATQWFSLVLRAGAQPAWDGLRGEGIEVLEAHRHGRKLRRGTLLANHFRLLLRDVSGASAALAARLARIHAQGVPNYFGAQRFGREQGNLRRAVHWFETGRRARASRHRQGLWLSAARAQLFNELLARRVERGIWHRAIPGDRLQLRGSQSHFLLEPGMLDIEARLDCGDLAPTGPLFGAGATLVAAEAARLEEELASARASWIEGLARAGLRQERRALCLRPAALAVTVPLPSQMLFRFSLPPGAYATALVREIADWDEPAFQADEDAAASIDPA